MIIVSCNAWAGSQISVYLNQFPMLNDALVFRKTKFSDAPTMHCWKVKKHLFYYNLEIIKRFASVNNYLQYHTNTLCNFCPDSSPPRPCLFWHKITFLALLVVKAFIWPVLADYPKIKKTQTILQKERHCYFHWPNEVKICWRTDSKRRYRYLSGGLSRM